MSGEAQPTSPPTRPRVVLIGPPGAGKTSVGRELARRWQVPFADTDVAVEALAGVSVAEIFTDQGEPRFRELERQAVATALGEHGGVLSLGGGAVMDPLTEAALAGHTVVMLDVTVAAASRRIGFNRDRPLLIGNPRAQWLRLMERRRPVYERAATHVVDTSSLPVPEVVAAIVAVVGSTRDL